MLIYSVMQCKLVNIWGIQELCVIHHFVVISTSFILKSSCIHWVAALRPPYFFTRFFYWSCKYASLIIHCNELDLCACVDSSDGVESEDQQQPCKSQFLALLELSFVVFFTLRICAVSCVWQFARVDLYAVCLLITSVSNCLSSYSWTLLLLWKSLQIHIKIKVNLVTLGPLVKMPDTWYDCHTQIYRSDQSTFQDLCMMV